MGLKELLDRNEEPSGEESEREALRRQRAEAAAELEALKRTLSERVSQVQLKEREARVRAGDARAVSNHRRKEVDPFANVPAFSEDMPMYDEPVTTGAPRSGTAAGTAADTATPSSPAPASPTREPRSTAGERPASKPVSPSASAKRDQPSRKPRSRRDKN